MIQTVVWNEHIHETTKDDVKAIYPLGIHQCIAGFLNTTPGISATVATLHDEDHGLGQSRLAKTDVLLWWGHMAHDKVRDEIVDRIQKRVLEGMGLIVMHSGHYSKIFKRLMGTSCSLAWREAGEKERVWLATPGHPIAKGIQPCFEIPHSEMYGEPFGIPASEDTVFISWFKGGEVFRSGLTFRRGLGKIFYFSPGHESYPIYHQPEIQRIISNAVHWAQPTAPAFIDQCPHVPAHMAPEKI